jgi:hypothetical protein
MDVTGDGPECPMDVTGDGPECPMDVTGDGPECPLEGAAFVIAMNKLRVILRASARRIS